MRNAEWSRSLSSASFSILFRDARFDQDASDNAVLRRITMPFLTAIFYVTILAFFGTLISLFQRRRKRVIVWSTCFILSATAGVLVLHEWNRIMIRMDQESQANAATRATTTTPSVAK